MYLQVEKDGEIFTGSVSDINQSWIFTENTDSSMLSYATSFAAVATAISMLAF
jgi:hypothetical protein